MALSKTIYRLDAYQHGKVSESHIGTFESIYNKYTDTLSNNNLEAKSIKTLTKALQKIDDSKTYAYISLGKECELNEIDYEDSNYQLSY